MFLKRVKWRYSCYVRWYAVPCSWTVNSERTVTDGWTASAWKARQDQQMTSSAGDDELCWRQALPMEVAMVLAVLKSRHGRIDTAKFTNVIVAGFINCGDLAWVGKVFIKNKAKVASIVGCSERGVMYFRSCCWSPIRKKLSFRRVENENICSHPGRDLL